MELNEIERSLPFDLEHYLTVSAHLSNNTAMKYIKVLKRILRVAVHQGWLENNPIDGFRCPYEEPQLERLTMTEVMKLYNATILCGRLAEVRDVFLFSCYTGFAYQDV